MKLFKKMMLSLVIGAIALTMNPVEAQAKQVGTFYDRPIYDNEFGSVDIMESDSDITNYGASYPSKYDPRTIGLTSAIEDQGQTNTCWAFASIAAIEGNIIKKRYENSTLNLSENHLAYFFYNRANDPLGYTKGDKNQNLELNWYQRGGNLYGTALHLSTWAGVVKQTTSENYANGEYMPTALSGGCYNRDYVVEDAIFYNYSVNNVKKAITQYGAVASGIGMFSNFISANTEAYYCPYAQANHAVAIVGWDDTYAVSNFNSNYRPSSPGAWIVKNSYGTSMHDGGYMYVSYEDASLCEIVAFDVEKASVGSDNNYQHDGTGYPSYVAFPSGLTYANVYTAKGAKSGYNETLDAVGVCMYNMNTNYTLKIYTGVTSKSNPTKGKCVLTQKGTLANAGYNRIDLKKAVTLTAGEKYSVVLKLSAAAGGGVGVGVEQEYANDWIAFKPSVSKNTTFFKYDGEWLDGGNLDDMEYYGIYDENRDAVKTSFRIKAYTSNTTQKTKYKLSSKSTGVSLGSTVKLSLNTTPSSVKRDVTWTSTNKQVATVSSSGKVKGKAYGTATIKAKFVAGKGTKTLKCTVTVGPAKVKSFKVKGAKKKITVTWKRSNGAAGYEISYSKKKSSGYKKLDTVQSGSTTKYSKKLKKGTYYVKMRPYMNSGGKKLYGSYTSAKKVKVK